MSDEIFNGFANPLLFFQLRRHRVSLSAEAAAQGAATRPAICLDLSGAAVIRARIFRVSKMLGTEMGGGGKKHSSLAPEEPRLSKKNRGSIRVKDSGHSSMVGHMFSMQNMSQSQTMS